MFYTATSLLSIWMLWCELEPESAAMDKPECSRQSRDSSWSANRPALRFLILFALIFAFCYFVFGVAPGARLGLIKPYTELLARVWPQFSAFSGKAEPRQARSCKRIDSR